MADLLGHPWEALPPGTADALRPGLATVGDEIIEAISAGVPAYARPLEGSFGVGIRMGVDQALKEFVDLIERPGADRRPGRDIYVGLGRGEARQGRTLDALLAAYRIGARVAWRRVAEAARAADLDPESLSLLAESIFAYIDELSAWSAEGYSRERSALAGEAERRRRRLVRLLVQDPPADEAAIEEAARNARWRLPGTLCALVWKGGAGDGIVSRLPPDAIAAPVEDMWCALVPDARGPGRARELRRATRDTLAVLGPATGWRRAPHGFRRALAALRLAAQGTLAADGLLDSDDHLATLLAHADEPLLADLAARRLAPLADASPNLRARLEGTLRAWLDHQGRIPDVAAALHVHPQTVRYRLNQLRERFGPALDDPNARFELALALRGTARAA